MWQDFDAQAVLVWLVLRRDTACTYEEVLDRFMYSTVNGSADSEED